jgi:aryl-alcohol dehydrogenase-like predicted oxidoreductase
MRYRTLGASDLQVSVISLGSWLTYSGGVDEARTKACLDAAFDAGINLIDTANVYGRGESERRLGALLADRPRDSYVLATKLYFPMSDTDRGLSRAQVLKQIDASLARLRVDHVDLYQCHRYDADTPLEETMEALTDVVKAGKARFLGFSEWSAAQIRAARAIEGAAPFVSSQPQYSMLYRVPEAEVFPECAEQGIGSIIWSPLAQGVLTGKYRPGTAPPTDSRAASDRMGGFMARVLQKPTLEAVERLRPIADDLDLSMAQLALAWSLRRPEVSSAIVGASRPAQVLENAAAADVDLTEDVIAACDAALEDVAITGA